MIRRMKIKVIYGTVFLVLVISALFVLVANSQDVSVCCEKTNYGAWCQNAQEENCDESFRKTPTSCEAVSFCRLGCCYDSQEGICMQNTPQKTCEINGGVWDDNAECDIPQCELGCCVLGNEAAFVSLVRCKRLSSFYRLETDFRKNIVSETECIGIAQANDYGACVYESDFQKVCEMTTRQGCVGLSSDDKSGEKSFYKDYLCTAEELGTICAPSEKTTCVEGKDEVYFVDSCGNPANIYDASKLKNKAYWNKVIKKEESCNSGSANANSAGCGNCDYFLGSYCRRYDRKEDEERPKYGNYICRDLNCQMTYDGEEYRHGESWCVYDGNTGKGEDKVGSRHWRHMCVFGEEIVEPCVDFRNEICIQDEISTDKGDFSQAACRVNRWQDCVSQTEEEDCENTDKRDCRWIPRVQIGKGTISIVNVSAGMCVPEFPPGLKFWEEESQEICSQGNSECIVEFEKGLFEGKKCEKNCECLGDAWVDNRNMLCTSLGDCGSKANFIDVATEGGFSTSIERIKKD